MAEEWKEVAEFAGQYEVSSLGNVRSIARTCRSRWGTKKPVAGRAMKASLQPTGYPALTLRKGGKGYRRAVHRLVALAFIPNPDGKPQVNHKNGDKTDNRAENLEWVTGSENCRHALAEELYQMARGEQRASAKLTEDNVREIRALARSGMFHRDIAAQFGVGRKAITKVVNFQRWKHVT